MEIIRELGNLHASLSMFFSLFCFVFDFLMLERVIKQIADLTQKCSGVKRDSVNKRSQMSPKSVLKSSSI